MHAFAELKENRMREVKRADKVPTLVKLCLKQIHLIVTMAINLSLSLVF